MSSWPTRIRPSKVEVTLGVSEEEDKVDVKVEVKEEDPERVYVTLDNTGTKASGKHRIGVSYQNANMGNRDQVLTLAYTTALDQPSGVKVDIFSIGYRLPLYGIGDSIDVIYGNSGTTTPASVLAPGGTLALNGKGAVFGLRYNHIFPRDGEYTSKLVLGYDYKYMNSRCTTNGVPTSIDPPGVTASCTPYTLRPVTATYSGQWQRPGEAIDFNIGFTHHMFPMGSRYTGPAGIDRYSFVTTRQTSDKFSAIRMGGSYSTACSANGSDVRPSPARSATTRCRPASKSAWWAATACAASSSAPYPPIGVTSQTLRSIRRTTRRHWTSRARSRALPSSIGPAATTWRRTRLRGPTSLPPASACAIT
jgi:hypothetical protein